MVTSQRGYILPIRYQMSTPPLSRDKTPEFADFRGILSALPAIATCDDMSGVTQQGNAKQGNHRSGVGARSTPRNPCPIAVNLRRWRVQFQAAPSSLVSRQFLNLSGDAPSCRALDAHSNRRFYAF